MQINFIKVDEFLYEFRVDHQVDYHQILADLKSTEWEEVAPDSKSTMNWAVARANPTALSTYTQEFRQYFLSDKFKTQIIDMLLADPLFQDKHKLLAPSELKNISKYELITAEELADTTKLVSDWIRTPPKLFDHPFHVDSHTPYAHGMLFFNEVNDPNQSTWFIPWKDGCNLKRILQPPSHMFRPKWKEVETRSNPVTNGFGCGWMLIATDYSWHRAVNLTDEPRYSLKLSLDLK